jgi:hypothetical protein
MYPQQCRASFSSLASLGNYTDEMEESVGAETPSHRREWHDD